MLVKFKENIRKERWKDTPFKSILAIDWQAPTSVEPATSINTVLPDNAVIITIYNGIVSERWVNDKHLPDTVLMRFDKHTLDIHIVEDAVIDRPIIIHHATETENDRPIHVSPVINVTVDAGAQASLHLIETGEGQYLVTPSVNMSIAEKAKIEWSRIAINSEQSFSVVDFNCEQGEESEFHLVSYQSRGQLSRADLKVKVVGEKAYTTFDGLNIAKGTQHLAHVVDMGHAVSNCSSHQQIKNIVKDRAMALFDGEIYIHKDAQVIDADQMTRSLILDDGARTLTIPRLEIYADDVQCTHGATVGFIEDEHMFYLQSRGINKQDASLLLMRAYGAEIIESVRDQSVQEWLLHVLDQDIALLV